MAIRDLAKQRLTRLQEATARGAFPVATDAGRTVASPFPTPNSPADSAKQNSRQLADKRSQAEQLRKQGDI